MVPRNRKMQWCVLCSAFFVVLSRWGCVVCGILYCHREFQIKNKTKSHPANPGVREKFERTLKNQRVEKQHGVIRARPDGKKTKGDNNSFKRQTDCCAPFGKKREYKQTQDTREKQKLKIRNENESTVEMKHQHRYIIHLRKRRRQPSNIEGSVPKRLVDDTLMLQGHRYPGERDLRSIK